LPISASAKKFPYEINDISAEERLDWLRLIRSENVGTKTFFSLLSIYGSASKALKAIPELSLKGGRQKPIAVYSMQAAEKEIEQCRKMGAQIIAACEPEYPAYLTHIDDYPPVITVMGNTKLLRTPSIAMVGARNASANGCRFAYKLAEDLGARGVVVASGLARGIDTAAHKGALATGTIAVIAGGIDSVYPPENKDLYKAIAEQGVIIAELPFGATPKGTNFPQRNRIISGLSYGVIVVEATLKSGSLITARMALEQNREVFSVPGFPMDPRCSGTNHLLKQGAQLVESAQDVIDAIAAIKERQLELFERDNILFTPSRLQPPTEDELDSLRDEILHQLGSSPISIDHIITTTGMRPAAVLTVILELELAGKLERHVGNRVSFVY
jgi:DNA processing protein